MNVLLKNVSNSFHKFSLKLNQKQIKAYHRDGFLLIKKLFDQEEIDLLNHEPRELNAPAH